MNHPVAYAPSSAAGQPSLVRCCAWLVLAMLAAFGAVAWYVHARSGMEGVVVAALAAAVCLAGSVTALILSAKVEGPNAAMLRLAAGMVFRMGVPLVACVAMMQMPRLAELGGLMMMAVFYLVALAVETPLSLKFIDRKPASGVGSARQENGVA